MMGSWTYKHIVKDTNTLFGWNSNVYAVIDYIQSPNMSKAWNKDDFSKLRTENARKKK